MMSKTSNAPTPGEWATGLLLADESGAVVPARSSQYAPADGVVAPAILQRERMGQGEWHDRLSYGSTEPRQNTQAPARQSVQRRSPHAPASPCLSG